MVPRRAIGAGGRGGFRRPRKFQLILGSAAAQKNAVGQNRDDSPALNLLSDFDVRGDCGIAVPDERLACFGRSISQGQQSRWSSSATIEAAARAHVTAASHHQDLRSFSCAQPLVAWRVSVYRYLEWAGPHGLIVGT